MKRILLALTLVGLLLPLAPKADAATEVSLNLFYDNLSPYGSWIDVGDYGYCFQPSAAVSSSDWRPYSDGYWAYTDAGWTWVSYEDFGWATYHYGRWANLDSYGWVWVPGYEWGPAWVSWRTGGDYVGWAPLPPQSGEVVYEGRAITGQVDVSFDIGPLYYNFVDIRYIGEPVLRGHILEPRRNVTIINRTVNVTNITYNNSIVVNHGPDLNRIDQFSNRRVQRLKLERETTFTGGRRGNLNRVNGSALVVEAPTIQRSKEKIAPKQVKTKVEKVNLNRGWQGVQNKQEIETAMKKENAKNVPPPTFKPQGQKGQAAADQPAQPNEPAAANNGKREQEKAARQAERQQWREQNAQPSADENAGEQAEQQNDREQKMKDAEQRRTEREQNQAERKAQRGEKNNAQEEEAQAADQTRARRAEDAEQSNNDQTASDKQQERRAQRQERRQQQQQQQDQAQQEKPKDQSANDRAQREGRQSDRPHRRTDQGQENAPQPGNARQRERAQAKENQPQPENPRQQERRAPQRAQERRQQQGQGDQQKDEGERKGKKKRPNEDQPPQS